MKTLLMILPPLALLGLSACSNPADPGTSKIKARADASELNARQALDKANAVQGQISDAEARRRESVEKAE